ncbi:acyl-CoA dehydrogenase family protein [Nocardia macrotermitis]|uniref:Acyl-CoA dehydrogenase/oxidase N-terminal domain-containing protein n=1 Tax=Nocardia macrotermitis TaxID=2585198 RepID=A0A7K0D7M1_9NOCA|nr:acyl-CoA dehydrogenase family protein [Nocardia macrotermitis]MQY21780.1 hypothetical protein [Nocardia macrotermitis]
MSSTEIETPPLLGSAEEALAAADAVAAQVVRGAVRRELEDVPPLEELRLVAVSGLLGIGVPSEHGGPDLPLSVVVEVLRRLSRADSAVGQLLLSHYVLGQGIRGLGHTAPAPRLYADILGGAQLGNATAERGTRTAAERVRSRPSLPRSSSRRFSPPGRS